MEDVGKGLSTREWIHRLVDVVEDERDLETLKWMAQQVAARSLNRKYKEEHKDEAH